MRHQRWVDEFFNPHEKISIRKSMQMTHEKPKSLIFQNKNNKAIYCLANLLEDEQQNC